jgi:outer membrane protein TolC
MERSFSHDLLNKVIWLILISFFSQVLYAQHTNLDFFVNSALRNSPLLKDFDNRVKSAKIDSLRIKAGQGIRINAEGTGAYSPVYKGWGYDEIKTDNAELSAIIQISKEFAFKGNLENKYESIRIENEATLMDKKLSEKDLKKTVISQYITAYGDQMYLELNTQVLDLLKQEEVIIRKLVEKGLYKQTEYLAFAVTISQQDLITDKCNYQLKTDHEILNYLCGIYDTTSYSLSEPVITVRLIEYIDNSFFMRQFSLDSLKLANSDRQIDFEYQPRISVFADGGYLSSLALTPWKNFGLSAGLSITVPIYDGKQKQMQHDKVAISQMTRSNYKDFFTSRFKQQIALLEHQLTSVDRIQQKTLEQQKYALALVDANRMLIKTGDIPVNDYLLSVNNYMNAYNMVIENNLERLRIKNELNYWIEK